MKKLFVLSLTLLSSYTIAMEIEPTNKKRVREGYERDDEQIKKFKSYDQTGSIQSISNPVSTHKTLSLTTRANPFIRLLTGLYVVKVINQLLSCLEVSGKPYHNPPQP